MRIAFSLVAFLVVLFGLYAANVAVGMHVVPHYDGTIAGLRVSAPVQILRDARGVPHIRAASERDAVFAEGYAQGTDRLFQLDLLRRFVYGRLSEVLGSATLETDEASRTVPVRAIVERQWAALPQHDKELLEAFAEGINAAAAREEKPPEFRALLYHMDPWRPQDALAVGFATTLDLIDSWNDVAVRTGREPLSDPCYDAPVTDGLAAFEARKAPCKVTAGRVAMLLDMRPPVGSNEWAAGAAHTATGRALLANDPHLRLGIPGVWYLVEISAPGYHVAGASLAGTPGIILGHNEHVAWGATNGTVASLSVYDAPPALDASKWHDETFGVRFGGTAKKRYYDDGRFFGANAGYGKFTRFVLVDWDGYRHPESPLVGFEGLNHANSMDQALAALRGYRGPTQNFEIADTDGRVAYQLAGAIPNDPLWATGVHSAAQIPNDYPMLPFDALPKVAPSRDAIVWTANNKMYGAGYPYRLSAEFGPPYRAARIAQLLAARSTYDVAYFESMQMDTLSLAERELDADILKSASGRSYPRESWQSRALVNLAKWDGRFTPDAVGASTMYEIRLQLARTRQGIVNAMLGARAPGANLLDAVKLDDKHVAAMSKPWGTTGAVVVEHPLAALGLSFLNGTTFAGNGDAYTVHVQNYGFSQSFRAVWDVGNWDAGGITIPQGECGLPGSPNYTDEAADWVAGRLRPLAFSTAAVDKAMVHRMTLTP